MSNPRGSVAAAGTALARTVNDVSERPLPMPFVAPVAGISYRQEVACRLTTGASVLLRREPNNPYDAHAVAIETDDELLGYLPRTLALRLQGEGPWSGVVSEVLDGQFIGVRVRVDGETPGIVSARQVRLAELTAVPQPASEPDPVDIPVFAHSGRLLGHLVTCDEDTVTVRCDDRQVPYPARLVRVGEPASR